MEKFELEKLDAKVQPAVVSVPNLTETVEQAKAVLKQYEDFPVVEETEKQAKAARAELNKAKKTVADIRKNTEKQLLGNWPEIKDQLKSVEETTDETAKMIGGQLKNLDDEKKQSKLRMVQKEINKICMESNVDEKKIELDQRWLNKTYPWGDMQNEINKQIEAIKTEEELLAMQITSVEEYAKTLDLEAEGYVAMLTQGLSLPAVKSTMENAKKRRELEHQARKDREKNEREQQQEAVQKAKRVGNHLVDETSGEIVEPVKEHMADYRYEMKQLTDKQKHFLDMQFKKWGINFTSKEL